MHDQRISGHLKNISYFKSYLKYLLSEQAIVKSACNLPLDQWMMEGTKANRPGSFRELLEGSN